VVLRLAFLYCDGGLLSPAFNCERAPFGGSMNEGQIPIADQRSMAKAEGWIRVRIDGRMYDLCPQCALAYKAR